MINRRSAIKHLLALSIVGVSSRSWREDDRLSFFVAGARYFPKQGLALGDGVVIRRISVGGEVACRVQTVDGAQIGFVPKQLIRLIANVKYARVEALALDGVPWRWYYLSCDLSGHHKLAH